LLACLLAGFFFSKACFLYPIKLAVFIYFTNGPGSSVGIATGYGLDGLWIESR
jgi:hypothetical protein